MTRLLLSLLLSLCKQVCLSIAAYIVISKGLPICVIAWLHAWCIHTTFACRSCKLCVYSCNKKLKWNQWEKHMLITTRSRNTMEEEEYNFICCYVITGCSNHENKEDTKDKKVCAYDCKINKFTLIIFSVQNPGCARLSETYFLYWNTDCCGWCRSNIAKTNSNPLHGVNKSKQVICETRITCSTKVNDYKGRGWAWCTS